MDDVTFDASVFNFQRFFPHSNYRSVDTIRAWSQMDWFHTYSGLDLFEGETQLSVGMRNAFDRQPHKVGMTSGMVGELQDALGRVMYARFSHEFWPGLWYGCGNGTRYRCTAAMKKEALRKGRSLFHAGRQKQ